jgi:hypothetical protein
VSADEDCCWVVVSVDRSTAGATTELWPQGDAAWEHAVELEVPGVYTTVVQATDPPEKRNL